MVGRHFQGPACPSLEVIVQCMEPLVGQGTAAQLAGQVDAHVIMSIMRHGGAAPAGAELDAQFPVQGNHPRRNAQQISQVHEGVIRRVELRLAFRSRYPVAIRDAVDPEGLHEHGVIHILAAAVILTHTFGGNHRENIRFGKLDATDEEIVAAANLANADGFIRRLPDGYDTVVGEAGGTLSGGERQRISIARALLKDAPIVILDEATASVDPENEKELQEAIDALTQNKTIIMIAHRLKTVRHANQILVLDNGHIVQQGTHEELAGEPGLYYDFLNARKEAVGWKVSR